MRPCAPCRVLAAAVALAVATLPGGTVGATAGYRSILGDPGMRWRAGAQHPRMQMFFYNLCSKAGPSNFSVVPSEGDTCEERPGVWGAGVVESVPGGDPG
eukprot:gene2069-3042_t